MMDIDHFKQINDSFGHLAGDKLLCEIANRLQHTSRSHEYIGRYGGEEFLAILCPYDKISVLRAAERFRLVIADKKITYDRITISATISLGVTVTHQAEHLNKIKLLQTADKALYQAKNNGRNRVEYIHNQSDDLE